MNYASTVTSKFAGFKSMQLSDLRWITPSLQLLCISDVVSQGASRPAAVISSTVSVFDIVFSAITTFLTVDDR